MSTKKAIAILVGINVILMLVLIVFSFLQSVNTIYMDDLGLMGYLPSQDGDQVDIGRYFVPHNFSRPALWRLAGVFTLYGLGISPFIYNMLPVFVIIILSLLFLRLIADHFGDLFHSLLAWTTINFILLSFVHEINLCWGAQYIYYLPTIFGVALFIFYRRCHSAPGCFAAYLAAVVLASFSYANGILVALLLPPMLLKEPFKRKVLWLALPPLLGLAYYFFYIPHTYLSTNTAAKSLFDTG